MVLGESIIMLSSPATSAIETDVYKIQSSFEFEQPPFKVERKETVGESNQP